MKFLPIPAALALAALLGMPKSANAASYTWNVTNGNWSTPTSWTPTTVGANGPLITDTVVFGNTDASTTATAVNSIVDSGFAGTIASLTYNSTTASAFNVTQIGSNQTLNVTGSFVVGGVSANPAITQAYFVGGGSLYANSTTFDVENYNGSSATSIATLNLSGLSSFIYNNPAGTISVADTTAGFLRAGGSLVLAVSNNITATNLNLSTSSAVNGGILSSIILGTGTNIINVANFSVANNKNSAFVTNSGGGVKIRGLAGTDTSRANITLGNRNAANSSGVVTGSLLLNGAPVDIKAAALIVGEAPNNGLPPTSGFQGNGVLQFDTGVIDATSLLMASNTSANNGASLGSSSGLVTVGPHGKLIVGVGGISLASQSLAGPSTGVLTISNGTVVCNGNISVSTNVASGSITFIGGGSLTLGANNTAGTVASPITAITLDNNVTLGFSLPSVSQPNIIVNTLNWASTNTGMTIAITSLPAGLSVGSSIPLISYTTLNGAITAPAVTLPAGVTGAVTQGTNSVILTITGGVGPGIGGVNQLTDSGFENGSTGWTTAGNANAVTVGSATYYNAGTCPPDSPAELVVSHSGNEVANAYGTFSGNTSWSQSVSTVAGSTYTASAYTLASHEDLMSGVNSFRYIVNFFDSSGDLLAAYQSYTVTNLTCGQVGGPFPLDTWNLLAVTNQMQVINGVNTGVIVGTIPSAVITAPPNAATAQFQAFFRQPANDGGSIYFDDVNFGLISGPVAPAVSAISPNLITLSTNTAVTGTASSSLYNITNVQVVVKSTTLGGPTTNTVTNAFNAAGVTVTGLNTPNVSISYALTSNTIYRSILFLVTDANGTTVASAPATLDTLQPTLVIEASDFNFGGGGFIDTPANGGLALYQGVAQGIEGTDEHKTPRTAAQSYYRPADPVITEAAAPQTGAPPTGTEQKFVTAAANGDTNDIEVEVGFNSGGDWLNYSRTFGSGGSAPAGTYNVWAYIATSGSGVEMKLSQLTSDPTQGNQTSNVLGNFGSASFTDASYNSFVYVPLIDTFGNRVSVTLAAGKQTLNSTVVGNPNIGFYILVPVAPILTPALQHIYPDGTVPYQTTNQLTFTVGPANGAALTTSGIGLVLNGQDVSSQVTYTSTGGSFNGTLAIASNNVYIGVLNVTNSGGLVSSFALNFDTFNVNNYTWEALDYDFSTNSATNVVSAQFIDNPIPTCDTTIPAGNGHFATNSYYGYPTGLLAANDPFADENTPPIAGAIAVEGVDVHFPLQSGSSQVYRNDTVASEVTTDYVRPKFLAAQQLFGDPNIGTFDLGYFGLGLWLNYTRHYPTNNYYIWGRLAGGAGPFSGTSLSIVTSGVGTANQTSNVLGTFSDPNAAGWQTWHWIPLRDGNGNMVSVPLSGRATLKLTSGNNLNVQAFMLTQAPIQFSLSAAPSTSTPGQIGINIPTQIGHTYTLMTSTSATGPWTPVGSPIVGDGTTHVISRPTTGAAGFFVVSVQ